MPDQVPQLSSKHTAAYALLYSLAFSHLYYYADIGALPLFPLFQLSSRAHPIVLGTLCFPIAATIAFKRASLIRGRVLPTCLFLLTATLSTIIAYYAITMKAHDHVDESYVLRSAAALFRYAIFFVAGYYLLTLIRRRQFVRVLSALYLFVVLHIFLNVDPQIPSMDFRYLSDRSNALRNYQFYADTFALFTLIVIATRIRRKARTALVIVSTICMFLLISTAAFYAYLLVAAFTLFDDYKGSWRRYVFPAVFLFICYWALISPSAIETESRIAGTFTGGLAYRASTLSRLVILQRGVDHLLTNSWLLGDFRAHYAIFGQPGTYIHNVLSLWADYGILAFVAFVALLLASLLYVPRATQLGDRLGSGKRVAAVYKYVLLFNLILVVGARSHFYPYVFLSFGMLFALREAAMPIAQEPIASGVGLRSNPPSCDATTTRSAPTLRQSLSADATASWSRASTRLAPPRTSERTARSTAPSILRSQTSSRRSGRNEFRPTSPSSSHRSCAAQDSCRPRGSTRGRCPTRGMPLHDAVPDRLPRLSTFGNLVRYTLHRSS